MIGIKRNLWSPELEQTRTSGKTVRYQIDSKNICSITLKQFLSHVLTKKDLTVYLSKYLKDYFEDSNRQYVLSYEKKMLIILLVYSNELQEHYHEEADTVLILHAVDIAKLNPFSECVAYSPDTWCIFLINSPLLKKLP